MVKKVIAILTLAVMTLTFAACSISDSESDAPKEPANLIGEWKQSGGSSSNYQVATITDSNITIYWYSKDDEKRSGRRESARSERTGKGKSRNTGKRKR